MRKVIVLFVFVFLGFDLVAQVRLTEVFPADGKKQFVELYSKPGSGYLLEDYFIVSYMKNASTGAVSIYLIDFNAGVSPFTGTNAYVVYSKYAGDKIGNQDYVFTNFSNVSTVWKYTKTVAQTGFTGPVANPAEDYFSDSQAEMGVFLFKKNSPTATAATLIDFVTHVKDGGSQTTKHALITASLNALPNFSYNGLSFSFSNVFVSKAKHVIADPGSLSYNLKMVNCIPTWFKDNATPWSGQLIDAVPTWDAFSFFYKQTGLRTISNLVVHDYYSAGEIPKESLSYINLIVNPKPMSSRFEFFLSFRYLLDATIDNIRISLYQDTDRDGIIDAGEPIVGGIQDRTPGDPVNLPAFTEGTEQYYRLNFSLAPETPTAELFFPVIVKTNYVSVTNGTACTFTTTEQIKFASDLLLPVSFGNLSIHQDNQHLRLDWTTHTESNNSGFEVQRSVSGSSNFRKIGFVDSKAKNGNSQTDLQYTFTDALLESGHAYYYRLKQIDLDGKSALSAVVHAPANFWPTEIMLYPNPSSGFVNVKMGTQGTTTVELLDHAGRVVRKLDNVAGVADLTGLPQGLYTVKFKYHSSGREEVRRLIIH